MHICQKLLDNRGCKKLTSTESGRQKLFQCSETLGDNLFQCFGHEKSNIKYHVNTFYQRYVRCAQRKDIRKENPDQQEPRTEDNNSTDHENSCRQSKRRKSEEIERSTLCIVCNQKKCKGDSILYRISVSKRAKQLLLASKFFKDEVYTRCSLLETPGDVFAADILYHNNCLSGYILKFKREIEIMTSEIEDNFTKETDDIINGCLNDLKMKIDTHYQMCVMRLTRN